MFKRGEKINHPTAKELYHYHLGPRFDPGAQAEIFEPENTLPLLSFRGAARLAGALDVVQHPQVYFQAQTIGAGLGGTIAGQIRFAPLAIEEGETGT